MADWLIVFPLVWPTNNETRTPKGPPPYFRAASIEMGFDAGRGIGHTVVGHSLRFVSSDLRPGAFYGNATRPCANTDDGDRSVFSIHVDSRNVIVEKGSQQRHTVRNGLGGRSTR